MEEQKVEPDSTVYNYLIDVYANFGDLEKGWALQKIAAEKITDESLLLPLYQSLAVGSAMRGDRERAEVAVKKGEEILKNTRNLYKRKNSDVSFLFYFILISFSF